MRVKSTSQIWYRFTLLVLSLALLDVSVADLTGSNRDVFRNESIFVGGKQRTYKIFVPSHLPNPAPLVLVFHGTQRSGRGIRSIIKISHFDRVAKEHQFLAIFPEAYDGIWNDGRIDHAAKSYRDGIDDIAFVRAIVAATEHQYHVDRARVYATGFSSGGIFCHYLAGQCSGMLAAIATVSGPMARPYSGWFHPKSAVSVLEIHGTEDPLVPYHGGGILADGGQVLSPEATAEVWAHTDRCRPYCVQIPIPGKRTDDGCYPQLFEWAKGKDHAEVVFYRIVGGGHTWPDSPPGFPDNLFAGPVCMDLDASQLIWKFFEEHPKRESSF